MDHACSCSPPAGRDRRAFVVSLLAGVPAAFPAAVAAVKPWEGPALTVDSVRRTVAGLAALYDRAGPAKISSAASAAELSIQAVFTAYGQLPPAQLREAKAVYAQLLTISANAAGDVGRHAAAAAAAALAASLAMEVGDVDTAGHAWCVAAGVLANSHRIHNALDAARRADAATQSGPTRVMACVTSATLAARTGNQEATRIAVIAAEREHARLPPDRWGAPGYSLRTYHPAVMNMFTGWSLTTAGLHREALPRLADAADLARGTGLMAFIWLVQARAGIETGDVDDAHNHAAAAVAAAASRPSAWVAATVAALNRDSGGAFADLAETVVGWGGPADG